MPAEPLTIDPVKFNGGSPSICTETLQGSVPSWECQGAEWTLNCNGRSVMHALGGSMGETSWDGHSHVDFSARVSMG